MDQERFWIEQLERGQPEGFRRIYETYKHDEKGSRELRHIRLLEYDQPIDPAMFRLQVPADAIVMDQWSQDVGLAQGDMTDTRLSLPRKPIRSAYEYNRNSRHEPCRPR